MKLHELDNIEIFRTGKWKNHEFTEKELDQMIENFNEFSVSWFRPAVKDGHHNDPGKPALGYISRLWKSGSKLLAKLVDMPEAVYRAIKAHGYDRVSIELIPRLERNGKTYHNVLSALSLLGVEVPEVDGLKPLRDSIYSEDVEKVEIATHLTIDGEHFAKWTAAYINDLPDDAFAVVESGEKDKEGKTAPRSKRHLPHHSSGVGSPTENETVDKAHLKNALARLDQTDIPDELKAKARAHLEAHAKSLNIGEYAEHKETVTMDEKEKYEKEIKELKAKIDEQTKEIEKAKETDDPKSATLLAQLDDAKGKIETLSKQLDESAKKMASIEDKSRETRIDNKVNELRVPALRPFVREYYNLASRSTETIKFSLDDKDEELAPEQIVDKFVERINSATENLFNAESVERTFERDDRPAEENARQEVDKRVREYMFEHKDTQYPEAMKIVLEADPKLKEEYAR